MFLCFSIFLPLPPFPLSLFFYTPIICVLPIPATTTTTAVNIGDISAMYKITEEVTNRGTNRGTNIEHTVKDIDGHLILLDE